MYAMRTAAQAVNELERGMLYEHRHGSVLYDDRTEWNRAPIVLLCHPTKTEPVQRAAKGRKAKRRFVYCCVWPQPTVAKPQPTVGRKQSKSCYNAITK